MFRNGIRMSMIVILYLAAFASAFNENIMNVALVSIAGEFSVSAALTQWLVTGYMIVTAVIIAIGAFLSERYTLRRLFFVAGTCLVVGEAVCILAPSFAVLLAGRLLQAVASGLFIPLMMNTVLACSPREKVGSYLAIGSAAITIGPAVAPVISGIAVTLFGWRSIFVFPLVFTLALVLLATRLVKNFAPTVDARCDAPSVALAAIGLTLFVYGIGQITASLFAALVSLVLGCAAIAFFVCRQKRLETPVLDVRPLADVRFLIACVLVMIAMMTTFSMSVLLPLYFEDAFGLSALMAGLLILPPIVVNALTAILAGRIMDRFGEMPLLPFGFALIVAGQVLVAAFGAQLALAEVIAGSVIVYAGVGLVMSPSQTSGLRILAPELHASGVAIVNVLLMVAASIGPSLFVGILSAATAGVTPLSAEASLATAHGFSQAVAVAAAIAGAGLVIAIPYALHMHKLDRASATGGQVQPQTTGQPTVADLMDASPTVVPPQASMRAVLAALVEQESGGAVLTDGKRHVAGFISDGDVMRALSRTDARNVNLGAYLVAYEDNADFSERVEAMLATPAAELATNKVVCVPEGASLEDACELFYRHHLKRLPVIDAEGRLVGLLNRAAISRYLMGTFIH